MVSFNTLGESFKAMNNIAERYNTAIANSTDQLLTHDQFEVAYKVAKSDGEVSSAEKGLLDKIRGQESSVDIYSKNDTKKEVKDSVDELRGFVENLKATRVTRAQALRIAYDMAGIDGGVKGAETKAIDEILGEAKSESVKPEPKAKSEAPKESIKSSTQNTSDVITLPKKKIKDPFVAALLMAIENDGVIDKQELKYLKRLEKSSAKKARPKKRRRFKPLFRMRIDFGSFFSFNFFSSRRLKKNKAPSTKLNHNLREAFKIAALDGKVNKAEINNLKSLL